MVTRERRTVNRRRVHECSQGRRRSEIVAAEVVEQLQQRAVIRNVAHRGAVMAEMDVPSLVDDQDGGHAAELEQAHLLFVQIGHGVLGVGQADKGYVLFGPIALESPRTVGADDQDLGLALYEMRIVCAQLRQMPAAEGSSKATGKDQHQMRTSMIVGEAHRAVGGVG
jgi:hypothetical protein